jgi:hypothetical protein
MGLSIRLVFPDGDDTTCVFNGAYSTFAALRYVIKFNETPATVALPGAAFFHDHDDATGEWSTVEIAAIGRYLEAVLSDATRARQPSRAQVLARMERDRADQIEQLKRLLVGDAPRTTVMFPATYPEAPVDYQHSGHESDAGGDETAGPALLAIPPTLPFEKMRDYDEMVAELARALKAGAEKKAKAVFC